MRIQVPISIFLLSSLATANAFVAKDTARPTTAMTLIKKPFGVAASSLFYQSDKFNQDLEQVFTSPVLQQVYKELVDYKAEFGHPNIPLGSKPGRQCQTLRRLHIQDKLTPEEIDWLTDIGFRFNSLEDVYHDIDFDETFQRLLDYEAAHPNNNFQVPKKCKEDPELGAWVTGIRRLGPDRVQPAHRDKLNQVGFAWVSTRKCGSKFMNQYRALVELVQETSLEEVLQDVKQQGWIRAQQDAHRRGSLSETRTQYMGDLIGNDWLEMKFD